MSDTVVHTFEIMCVSHKFRCKYDPKSELLYKQKFVLLLENHLIGKP